MKRIKEILFSTQTMTLLLLVFGVSMACATFIESNYDTNLAKTLVYNSIWFELLMLWLIVIFIRIIKKYKLTKKEKWPILLFHLAFVFMFLGGAITRYFSFEGIMPIKEGQTTNEIISDKTYFKMLVTDGKKTLYYDNTPYRMSFSNSKEAKWPIKRNFEQKYRFDDQFITLKSLDYIPLAKDSLELFERGKKILKIVTLGQSGRVDNYIEEGEIKNIDGVIFSFNKKKDGLINLTSYNENVSITFPEDTPYISMTGQKLGEVLDTLLLLQNSGVIKAFNTEFINHSALYTFRNLNFIIPQSYLKGKIIYYSGDKNNQADLALPDLVQFEINSGNEKDTLLIKGGRGVTSLNNQTIINGLGVSLGFGSKIFNTEFALRCDDFSLSRYPGSSNPSSYESKVTLIDKSTEKSHLIYMNNVLDYKGYRFFQASYFPDESGTVLSVNSDYWGTKITYIGYFFLFSGMVLTLFWKGSRFMKLNSSLKRIQPSPNLSKTLILVFIFGIEINKSFAQTHSKGLDESEVPSQIKPSANSQFDFEENPNELPEINQVHAERFGYLLVQDYQGRVKPINTLSLELLRKIYKKDYYKKDDQLVLSDQWFISMQTNPSFWSNEYLIKVDKKGGDQLQNETLANEYGYTTYSNLVDPNTGSFKLEKKYFSSFNKNSKDRTNYDRAIIDLTERFNIFSNVAFGYYTRIIPVKDDALKNWRSWIYNMRTNFIEIDNNGYLLLTQYFDSVKEALKSGNWELANENIVKINKYQQEWGNKIIPSEFKVRLEVFYNSANIFFWLMVVYLVLGIILLISGFILVFPHKVKFELLINILVKIILRISYLALIIQIIGLAIRWYISGHAPWSNGYEAIIFISAIGVLSGIILFKNRNVFIPAAGLFVATIMMGFAHGGSMLDPQITPLEPVLKSYWLMVHVGIITSSYGFFGLSTILSIISLILYNINSKVQTISSIKELAIVNEMSLTIGIFALTIGTFLGGIWANESWGRYWSWDPKETWAFISIIIYAFVLHLRLVPNLRGNLIFNITNIWAIWSIIFTYFGVNYYLTGLHSYAAGDPIPIPVWIIITIIFMLFLSITTILRGKSII